MSSRSAMRPRRHPRTLPLLPALASERMLCSRRPVTFLLCCNFHRDKLFPPDRCGKGVQAVLSSSVT
ncbi:hypothetical protein E2C01_078902 [Portunus trituberculatus]|uniref:Uncharacterized protein n=1 Tax=Portunus trituberculatus TaxID=210409 RepID=A0A5B7IVD7_PORTR|nr:hypothetical protein [Portunus trituberculatus]